MNLLLPTNATELWTVVLVVITAAYAAGTFLILRANRAAVDAMREQTESLLRPYVSVEVCARPGTTLMQLVVRNTGKSAAEGLRMSIDRPLQTKLDHTKMNLQDLPLFSGRESMSLAAGAELIHLLGIGHKLFSAAGVHGMPETFLVSAEYAFGGRRYIEKHTVDVRPLIHTSVQHDPIATAIRDAAEKLAKVLSSLDAGRSGAGDRIVEDED
jgi:hypothetical protein